MFQTLLALLPHTTAALALWLGLTGFVVGGALWLGGARHSRGIIALLAVLAGGIIGRKMPAWCGWSVDGMGTAVAGAMLVGFLGFALHRLWVGAGLGIVLACWTALAGSAIKHIRLDWAWPVMEKTATVPGYLQIVWNTLPVPFAHIVMIAACVSLLTGMVLAAATPRLSVLLFWSWTGVSMAVVAIAIGLQSYWPGVLSRLLPRLWIQGAIVGGLVIVGILLQAWLWKSPKPAPVKKAVKPKNDPET